LIYQDDYSEDDDTNNMDPEEVTWIFVGVYIALPLLLGVPFHTYLILGEDEDFTEADTLVIDEDSLSLGNEVMELKKEPIRYNSPVVLRTAQGGKCCALTVRALSNTDAAGLLVFQDWRDRMRFMFGGGHNQCLPERWIGTGSIRLTKYDDPHSTDEIRVGDEVYITTSGRWSARWSARWGLRGRDHTWCDSSTLYVATDQTVIPCPFKIHAVEWQMTNMEYTRSSIDFGQMQSSGEVSFSVVAYNVWMMPQLLRCFGGLEVSPEKDFRARQIPLELHKLAAMPPPGGSEARGLDLVVFSEAFCDSARPVLLENMRQIGFHFQTSLVDRRFGSKELGSLSSGVVAVSKHPIVFWDFKKFEDSIGDDAMANKGVLYLCIVKQRQRFHIFGSHTQAWQEPKHRECRAKQFRTMHAFLQEQRDKNHF